MLNLIVFILLALTFALLFEAIGFDFIVNATPTALYLVIALLILVSLFAAFHKTIWNYLSGIIEKKAEEVTLLVSKHLSSLREALLSANSEQLSNVCDTASSQFSSWYQKFLFKRFLIKTILALVAATAGLTTLVFWKEQNNILNSQLEAVTEQVRIQRQQWFLNQRTQLMSLLYDREQCPEESCRHTANLRTRTQAAITLIQVANNEIKAHAKISELSESVLVQPESMLNLSYVDLKDTSQERSETSGHGAYLANLDWSIVSMPYSDLTHSSLANTNLSDAKLQYAKLVNTNLNRTNLTNLFGMGAKFNNSKGHNTIFTNADLQKADFSGTRLTNADFSNANLSEAIFNDAKLNSSNFQTSNGITCEQLSQASSIRGIKLPKNLDCPRIEKRIYF